MHAHAQSVEVLVLSQTHAIAAAQASAADAVEDVGQGAAQNVL